MTWQRGATEVSHLLAQGLLEPITGAAANGISLLGSAESLIESARRELNRNPEASYILAFDAARKACASLITQQGLRVKSGSHHRTVEEVVGAQFGGVFSEFGILRARRNEIEYPRFPGDVISPQEATMAVDLATAIHVAAAQLIGSMTLFRP